MPHAAILASDLVAISLLAYGVYFRRHHRRDMLLAYLGLNLGVISVTIALDTAGVGLGLGLFGILSIIRLRSAELSQAEVAYYFVSLTMGLVGGLTLDPAWAGPALIGTLLAVMYVADHPQLLHSYRHQVVTLDAVYSTERELLAELGRLLGGKIMRATVTRTDFHHETTTVDVRYRVPNAVADA